MADANKPVRLSKAAREFNLGIGTIVDFLDTKGIQVEAKPNTKLDPEVYALVRSNFQGDKDAKEAAQRSTVNVDRENVSLASAKKKEVEEHESSAEKIDLNIASIEELQTLPGVGISKAKAIIAYRQDVGPFLEVAQITEVKGIGEKMLSKLQGYVVVKD